MPTTTPDPAGDPQPRSRLEDEVLEILHRVDRPPSVATRLGQAGRRLPRSPRLGSSYRVAGFVAGPGKFLVGALAAALLAALARGASPLLATLLALASIGLLACLWVPRYGGGARPKRWRGRDLDLAAPAPISIDDIRRRFGRPPRR